jgi:hypothetical protein
VGFYGGSRNRLQTANAEEHPVRQQ